MYCKILLGNPSKPNYTFRSAVDILDCSIDLQLDEFGSSVDFTISDPELIIASRFLKIIYDSEGLEPPVVSSSYERIGSTPELAVNSLSQAVQTTEENINPNVSAGQQISVEMGLEGVALLRYEFIHDSLSLNFNNRELTFGGSVASKVMTQYAKNTAYSNIKFSDLTRLILTEYGLEAAFDPLKNDPVYEYIPQYGISDYQFILNEAKRLGYRVTTKGKTVTFSGTEIKEENVFRLAYKDNLINCDFSYTVDAVGSDIRASIGSDANSYGARKWNINDTGVLVPIRAETESVPSSTRFTTGSSVRQLEPATVEDKSNVENEKRAKGLVIQFSTPFDVLSSKLDPNTGIIVEGISETLNRVFIPEKIAFKYSNGGIFISGSAYSPLKPKYKQTEPPVQEFDPSNPESLPAELSSGVPGSGSVNQRLLAAYRRLGAFETRSVASRYGISPSVSCVAALNFLYQQAGLTPIWGSTLAVLTARNALRNAGLRPIPRGQELPGDIHLVSRDFRRSHIGMCLGNGQAVSNSSSRAAFIWISPLGYPPTYRGSPINEVYRDNRSV